MFETPRAKRRHSRPEQKEHTITLPLPPSYSPRSGFSPLSNKHVSKISTVSALPFVSPKPSYVGTPRQTEILSAVSVLTYKDPDSETTTPLSPTEISSFM
eukprot:NODE_12295_length_403_cov_29.164286_g11637_i0.p1 GENE.NODE_12295_length_403_cov_29.164286_g11637_i0~~NODE_12295_length_403_cov_29.164286_g11637_i0.p1  ORF type:complete len:100 (+),score=11.14 NODE_12295_length_403_cov_29.164286_g11637_i0:72-371(+)